MHRTIASIVLMGVLVGLVACTRKSRAPTTESLQGEPARQAFPMPQPAPADSSAVAAANPDETTNRKATKASRDLTSLHLEVTALEVISQLQLTRAQLQYLAKLAHATVGKPGPDASVKGSDELHKVMTELRAALIADEEERIADLSARLEELRDKEHLDAAEVAITEQARQHTPEVLRRLSARQVALYLADYAEDFPDPAEKLSDALEEVRETKGNDADQLRDDVAAQVGWLVAGLDATRARQAADQARALLRRAQGLSDAEFQNQHEQLEKSVNEVAGKIEPTEVIRHFLQRTLAELLSNPRLEAVVSERLAASK